MPLGGEELIPLVVRRIPPLCIIDPIRGAIGTSGVAKLIPWNQGARCSPMIGVTPPSRRPHPWLRKFEFIEPQYLTGPLPSPPAATLIAARSLTERGTSVAVSQDSRFARVRVRERGLWNLLPCAEVS
jgi:hypothetical protein